ncbi:MAG TPA: hypothetical protein PKC96_02110 [Bacilli bacterium]|nr:hypothetical protein [Bacilli bacterium]
MKKTLIFVVAASSALLLAGCGGNGDSSSLKESSVTSEEPVTSTTSEETTSEAQLQEIYDYEFDSLEDVDSLALPTLMEGTGIVVKEGGYASTVKNGDLEEGPADNWTFVSGGYDHDAANFILETKVKAVSADMENNTAVASIRISYDWTLDAQLNIGVKEGGWSGVMVYTPDGTNLGASNDPAKGGLAPNLTLNPDTYYTYSIQVIRADDSHSDVTISIDGEAVIYLPGLSKIDANAAHIMGAGQGSHLNWDYFKLSKVI